MFISNVTSGGENTKTAEKKDEFYGSLNIDDIPIATNSARFTVTGTVTNYDELEFYINGKKIKDLTFKSSDSFSEEIGSLQLGQNEVYFKALTKKSKEQKESPKYSILYKTVKPKLEILEPAQETTKTSNQEIKISGKTDQEVFIKINNLPTVIDSSGNFQTTIRLKEGENVIEVTAEDNAGNIERKTFTVSYQKDE